MVEDAGEVEGEWVDLDKRPTSFAESHVSHVSSVQTVNTVKTASSYPTQNSERRARSAGASTESGDADFLDLE